MRADRLKNVRESRNLTQKDLGTRVGLSDQQIYRYETGSNDPTSEVLTRIAKELEVSTDYLLGLVDNPSEHFNEDQLTAREWKLIHDLRNGSIVEVLKSVTEISENKEQQPVAVAKHVN